jgi:hypothetical protein
MTPDLLMLIAMIGAHHFFDYAGQGDFMAKAKNPTAPIPGVPWMTVLRAHASIHAAAVALITGVWWLFFLEYVAHYVIDEGKCRGSFGFNTDQVLHIVCKFAWFVCAAWLE